MRTKCVETEVDNFDLVKVYTINDLSISSYYIPTFQQLEDEIIFKNQELQEFVAGIKTRDEKIQMLENIWFRSQRNAPSEVNQSICSFKI